MKYTFVVNAFHQNDKSIFSQVFCDFILQKLKSSAQFPIIELEDRSVANGLKEFLMFMREGYLVKLDYSEADLYQSSHYGDQLFDAAEYGRLSDEISDHINSQSVPDILVRLKSTITKIEDLGEKAPASTVKIAILFAKGFVLNMTKYEGGYIDDVAHYTGHFEDVIKRTSNLASLHGIDYSKITLTPAHDPTELYSVISIDKNRALFINSVIARDEYDAFYQAAKMHPNNDFVSAHKGDLTQGRGMELAGTELLDGKTILEQKDVFSPLSEDEEIALNKDPFKPNLI